MKVCEDGMKKKERERERVERLCRSEKIPEGSVVRWLLSRSNVKGSEKKRG